MEDDEKKIEVILASQSPRRRELLAQLGIPFSVEPSDVEEITDQTQPKEIVCDLALLKGSDIFEKQIRKGRSQFLVISADTLVCLEDYIFGKPNDEKEARETLRSLGGRKHQVLSGVALFLRTSKGKTFKKTFAVQTDVTFSELNDELIDLYIATGDSMDKAGAYGIQGPSSLFVKSLHGSYSNVVGFPLVEFLEELADLLKGANLWKNVAHPLSAVFGKNS